MLPISEGGSLVSSILTPKFSNLPISGKFCAIEVVCNLEILPIFLLEISSLFLDVNMLASLPDIPRLR